MNKICQRCNWKIIELDLSEELRFEICGLLQRDLEMFAIKTMKNIANISLADAKGVILHLNKEFGNCIRCDFTQLDEENMECPKCKAFNYNWRIAPSFNQQFCTQLEWKLDFENLNDEKVKGFWCDGIDHLPNDVKSLAIENLVKNRQIRTKAWLGNDGQEIYEMVIKFGPKSIDSYIKHEDLIDCIPNKDDKNWIKIEPENKYIEIELK